MRALTLSFGVLFLAADPRLATAGPKAWFDEGKQQCGNPRYNPDGSFECSICGAAFTCSSVDPFSETATCRWGELEAPNLDTTLLSRGFNLYCEGSGGAVISSASTAAMHAQLPAQVPGLQRSKVHGEHRRVHHPVRLGRGVQQVPEPRL